MKVAKRKSTLKKISESCKKAIVNKGMASETNLNTSDLLNFLSQKYTTIYKIDDNLYRAFYMFSIVDIEI